MACWIDDAIDIVEEAPTADVAPKSEVDWNSIPVDVCEALKQRAVEKAKTEVAREIIAELLDGLQYEIDMEDKQGRSAWENGDTTAYQIHQYAEEKLETFSLALSIFAKKYTGEQT
jgi:hypothetical protein